MEPIFEFSLDATRWLQQTYPQLQGFFHFISQIGLEEFYLIFIPLIYWCFDKRLGKFLGYTFLFANVLNVLAKEMFRGPRPYWLDSSVELWEEPSYGIPSGHTQAATLMYVFLAAWIRKRWMWLIALFMVVAMAVSRVYLGSHFIHDVVAGIFISLLVVAGFFWGWQRYAAKGFEKRILGYRLFIAVLIPVVLGLVYVGMKLLLGPPNTSVPWVEFVPVADREGIEGIATAVGALLGIGIGVTLEGSRVHFRVEGPDWKRAARYLLGLVIALSIWAGLKEVFPEDPLWVAIPLRILRYVLLTLWVGLYAPMTFVRLGLAEAAPEPEVAVRL